MTRWQRPQRPDPDAWIIDLLDDVTPEYNPATDPLSDTYRSSWMIDYRQIKALELRDFARKPTRIDLVETTYGPAKRIWLAGWMPGDPPSASSPLAAGWTLASAADHLEAEGWKVRRWEGGARAWRVDLRPVRLGRRLEYARELFRKQGRKNLDNQALLLDY